MPFSATAAPSRSEHVLYSFLFLFLTSGYRRWMSWIIEMGLGGPASYPAQYYGVQMCWLMAFEFLFIPAWNRQTRAKRTHFW
jgi:hypothetical protein